MEQGYSKEVGLGNVWSVDLERAHSFSEAGSFMGAGAKLDAGLRGKGWETQFGVRGEIQESRIRIFTKTVDVMDAT